MYKKLEKLFSKANITIVQNCTHHHGPISVVELTDSKGNMGVGISKKSPKDVDCAQKGEEIARGRAEKALFKHLNNKPINHIYMG